MQDPDFISLFVAPLETAGIRYMITGSVASSIYGEPRNTLDIDIVVLLHSEQIDLLPALFPENDFYLPPSDVVIVESHRESRGHFNIIHHNTGLKADIYLSRNHPSLPWALTHTRRVPTPNCEITVAPPEYVILHKLEFYRESGHQRHLRDIAGMIEQQELDLAYLESSIRVLQLATQWQAAKDLTNR
ncbi:MAG: hypothetical protein H8M99_15025 [Gloeobacteraceae cyanobacterium ES-bin-144]|nr:hypothetical protein [Verrucomicrobiales bacterium]